MCVLTAARHISQHTTLMLLYSIIFDLFFVECGVYENEWGKKVKTMS